MTSKTYPKEIILIRHGQSEGNLLTKTERAKWSVGTNRYKLTPLGISQAMEANAWMEKNRPDIAEVFTSYYTRTVETAQNVFPNRKLVEDPRLTEIDRGVGHTLTDEELSVHHPSEHERKRRSGTYHYRPVAGTSWADKEMQIRSFLQMLRFGDYAGESIAIVSHAHCILIFQKVLEGWSVEEVEKRDRDGDIVANASISIYTCDDSADSGWSHNPDSGYIEPSVTTNAA